MGSEQNTPTELPFSLLGPAQQRVPFIFNSPHSGDRYSTEFCEASSLTFSELRKSEDVAVDQLFDSVVEIGAPLLRAHFPRAWLDVNREPFELDPRLFRERIPAHANIRSMRVAGGLGTIPRVVSEHLEIYRQPPSLQEALHRIETVYRPYHASLRRLIAETAVQFGYSVLVDCHSMPSLGQRYDTKSRPDIIIGDRYGTACHIDISLGLVEKFSNLGYKVTRNKPYAGGFITEHYGRPLKGLHAVQIEITRSLYMDEQSLCLHDGFIKLKTDIQSVMSHLVSLPDVNLAPIQIAAE